ncbi:addiction module protein [Metapseudomonas furukawaii]|jgi:putative addiction module component (TIGR02574 family)|uniref:addiction module protein n=1 Tax=Metapseudomonas furukawaii TaxID=1149133 RepID=UPI00227C93E0|nr:addiction module protein [Pseudomonas furukawaii]WAG80456.1 addiction module protein [Pseudomonas furukawaii]
MSQSSQSLSREARRLSINERVELVEDLLDSLDTPDATLDAQWGEEAEDRLDAYRRGELKALPLAEVLGKYLNK